MVMQRPAKPRTPVRFRPWPPRQKKTTLPREATGAVLTSHRFSGTPKIPQRASRNRRRVAKMIAVDLSRDDRVQPAERPSIKTPWSSPGVGPSPGVRNRAVFDSDQRGQASSPGIRAWRRGRFLAPAMLASGRSRGLQPIGPYAHPMTRSGRAMPAPPDAEIVQACTRFRSLSARSPSRPCSR